MQFLRRVAGTSERGRPVRQTDCHDQQQKTAPREPHLARDASWSRRSGGTNSRSRPDSELLVEPHRAECPLQQRRRIAQLELPDLSGPAHPQRNPRAVSEGEPSDVNDEIPPAPGLMIGATARSSLRCWPERVPSAASSLYTCADPI